MLWNPPPIHSVEPLEAKRRHGVVGWGAHVETEFLDGRTSASREIAAPPIVVNAPPT